jgi:hypothetical protein
MLTNSFPPWETTAVFVIFRGHPGRACPYYIYYTKPRPFGAAVFSILLPGKSLANLLE